MEREAFGWAARDSSGILSPFTFTRRANGARDITIKILYCGICHTDLHFARNSHGFSVYPLVPGHEIMGEVLEVGCDVRKFRAGDKAGVGCLLQTCGDCEPCRDDLENYCPKAVYTYGDITPDRPAAYGGYSNIIVVDEHYAIRVPDNCPLDSAAPLLCAGITVYSPMQYFGLNRPGLHIGVVGLGGLGHVAVKFAKAFGMKVTVISSSPDKEKEAVDRLGADAFLVSHNEQQMKNATGSMDGILDTASAPRDISPFIGLLKHRGKLVILGAVAESLIVPGIPMLVRGKVVAGSMTGGIKETQEMIDFAAKHNVSADVEVVPIDYVNTAMERLAKGDVRYRFVIDVGNTLVA